MKTKIIYISGNEVFDMADIRAAFDEVRAALGLGADTVMFGVPVDADDALAVQNDANIIQNTDEIITDVTSITQEIPTIIEQSDEIKQNITEPAVTQIPSQDTEKPKKTVRRGRPKKSDTEIIDSAAEQNLPEPVAADVSNTDNTPTESTDTAEKIIPILSVLGNKSEPVAESEPAESAQPAPVAIDTDAEVTAPIIADIDINAELSAPSIDDDVTDAPIRVTIGDMINDEAPVAAKEKTLEELLESMTPLREDHIDEDTTVSDVADDSVIMDEPADIATDAADDGDATLEKLAAEFAQTEDTIVAAPRAQSHGKIGKLKNILPFKKAKREDAGIMGDLFGWAGIAANDEDFSIPGFFTPTAAKK